MASALDDAALLALGGFWAVAIGFTALGLAGVLYDWWWKVIASSVSGALLLSYLYFNVFGR